MFITHAGLKYSVRAARQRTPWRPSAAGRWRLGPCKSPPAHKLP